MLAIGAAGITQNGADMAIRITAETTNETKEELAQSPAVKKMLTHAASARITTTANVNRSKNGCTKE